jgi:hypothetical protein
MSMEDQTCASVMFFPEQTDGLSRRDLPVEFSNSGARLLEPKDFIFSARRLTPKLWLLPPPFCSRELRALDGVLPPPDRSVIYPRCWKAARRESLQAALGRSRCGAPHCVRPTLAINRRLIHQVGGIPFSIQDPVETDCVKFGDDDYSNHPTVKAFRERMEKDGAPIDWPDYEEAWQAYSAFEARERATHFALADSWQLVLQIDSDYEAGMQWGDAGRIYVCIRKPAMTERRFDRCWTVLQCY